MDESELLIINSEQEIGDEFYEQIEAPKFVDLTAPDPFQPGQDRSWFCWRVGCDQNHDEEMDSEAIYKNFVLRVMAARSPNVRLRRALCRKDSSLDVKCPRTVPAKPSKSRVTRTALISLTPKRVVDHKVEIKPLSKQNPTPKDRVVAKTLVFDSPKKAAKTKISEDLNAPLKTLCTGIKKLEITRKKKLSLGCNRPFPSKTSQKQIRRREVKSRVFNGLNIQTGIIRHTNSSKCLEKNKKGNNVQKNCDSVYSGKVQNNIEKENAKALTDASRIEANSMLSDDKENALASNESRKLYVKTRHIESKIFGKHKSEKGNQEATSAKGKHSKENKVPVSNGSQCLKVKKPKPTNPKPFRLRTDERGILKEANFSEFTAVSTISLEQHQNASKRDSKCLEQNEKHDQPKNRTCRGKNGKERIEQKMPSIPERHTVSSKQKLVASLQKTSPKPDNITRKSKPRLGAIKEAIPTYLRATESAKQRQNGGSMATKASAAPNG